MHPAKPNAYRVSVYLLIASPLLISSYILSCTLTASASYQTAVPSLSIADPPDVQVLRVRGLRITLLRVTVDGTIVHNGYLRAQEQFEWTGQQILLWTSNAGAVEVAFNDEPPTLLGDVNEMLTRTWPDASVLKEADPDQFVSDSSRQKVRELAVYGPEPSLRKQHLPKQQATRASADPSHLGEMDLRPPRGGSKFRTPQFHIVESGDTLFTIAERYSVEMDEIITANDIADPNWIGIGTALAIPGSNGSLPDRAQLILANSEEANFLVQRGSVVERMTDAARHARATSPFHSTTWVTYYGRPFVPIMGILGEHDVDALALLLQQQAAAYDEANGDDLSVTPAFHLVYGMATKAAGDGSHLAFLEDELVEEYIAKAKEMDFAVILDIQIGGLTPAASIEFGLPWLKYDNVHLAIDPEFAKVHGGQAWPGLPIGYVTAQQVNEVQEVMRNYIEENDIPGPRILLVHQFQESMIVNKEELNWDYDTVELTISVDGWGPPFGKISKYNFFVDTATEFTAFKLFYGWDNPLMTERQALGIDPYGDGAYIDVTPNLIIYQ